MTGANARNALLYDTVASLRLLDTELRALDVAPEAVLDAAGRAAADVFDALDRVQALLDDLESAEAERDAARARLVRRAMRGELAGVVDALRTRELSQ